VTDGCVHVICDMSWHSPRREAVLEVRRRERPAFAVVLIKN